MARQPALALNSIYITGINGDTVGALDKSVLSALSSVPTAGSLMDLFSQFARATPGELITLASTIAVAGYLVLRPLASAFRIKRIIFNLAAAGEVDLNRTTTTWNVARSIGLYHAEREVLLGLGAHAPREFDFDLWISAIAAGVLLWGLWPGHIIERGVNGPFWVIGVMIAFTLAIARIAWLVRTGVFRRHATRSVDPAAGLRLPATGAVVEARSVLETASLGYASAVFCLFFLVNAHVVLPSPVWVRLVRERRDFERALALSAGGSQRLSSASIWPAVGSALSAVANPAGSHRDSPHPPCADATARRRLCAPHTRMAGTAVDGGAGPVCAVQDPRHILRLVLSDSAPHRVSPYLPPRSPAFNTSTTHWPSTSLVHCLPTTPHNPHVHCLEPPTRRGRGAWAPRSST